MRPASRRRSASPGTILKVDLYGTALVLEEVGKVIDEYGSRVVISSQSGHRLLALSVEHNQALATSPVEALLALPFLQPGEMRDLLHAYQLSKRGNSLRVMAEAVRWGKRRARINTTARASSCRRNSRSCDGNPDGDSEGQRGKKRPR